jgi:hypothetical protein
MKIIIPFDDYYFLNEDVSFENVERGIGPGLVTKEEYEAMRTNPEKPELYKKYEKYYTGETARRFVDKVIQLVSSFTFEDPRYVADFMSKLVKTESCYGTNPSTYKRPNETKGMFQLDKNSALKTIGYKGVQPDGNAAVKEKLRKAKERIKSKLNINWDEVPYESLGKPLYSALACRLFIETRLHSYDYDQKTGKLTPIPHPIPKDLNGQAEWWKKRYNSSAGKGTVEAFKNPIGCSI